MKLVKEYLYDDVYYIDTLNESLLNEQFNIEKMKNIISNIKDKSSVFNQLIKKFNITNNFNIKKNISRLLLLLFLGNFAAKNNTFNKINIEGISTKIAKETTIDTKKLKDIIEEEKNLKLDISNISTFNYKTAKTSNKGKKLIKDHEKLRLDAYSIGDGRITIGYGHAYLENKSPYNVGDKITPEKAEVLFNKDIHRIEEGIKRMFAEWEKEGVEFTINQSMFDALVSMGFNMGISGLRNTEFIKHLKNNDLYTAAEKIKTTKTGSIVSDNEGNKKYVHMPGLIKRRQHEHNLFTQEI